VYRKIIAVQKDFQRSREPPFGRLKPSFLALLAVKGQLPFLGLADSLWSRSVAATGDTCAAALSQILDAIHFLLRQVAAKHRQIVFIRIHNVIHPS
jgi:hypothetical protein